MNDQSIWLWIAIVAAIVIYLVAEGYVWWRAFIRKNRPSDTSWQVSWFIYPPLTLLVLLWMIYQ